MQSKRIGVKTKTYLVICIASFMVRSYSSAGEFPNNRKLVTDKKNQNKLNWQAIS